MRDRKLFFHANNQPPIDTRGGKPAFLPALPNGMECVITEHGLAQVPLLDRVPDFNLEEELGSVSQFVLEPVGADVKSGAKPTPIGSAELSAMLTSAPLAAAREHEPD